MNGVEATDFIPYQTSIRVTVRDLARFGQGENKWNFRIFLGIIFEILRSHMRGRFDITTDCDDCRSLSV